MKTLAFVVMIFPVVATAQMISCPKGVVSEGVTVNQVYEKCGAPTASTGLKMYYTVNSVKYTLEVDNGIVTRIDSRNV